MANTYEQAPTLAEAEKARTKPLDQVDEQRHPKRAVTMSFLLDRWLGVAELDEMSYERAEGIIRNYLKRPRLASKARCPRFLSRPSPPGWANRSPP
ncbi:hypothetical protein HRW23_14080 [Streptomyces lunaelactis]|uniref:hypothetical protein n=1 Tax=Streptomyces lunaelactis TaxID=1535768 RepID=UPI001585706C|nr:hypothetical protein [Streptomyces lunaelactis]NUK70791.1 hypothetical protein [Streptomyces lunaelactis]NUK78498.1 hypothetical protein [Streptomyces lunaelactis]